MVTRAFTFLTSTLIIGLTFGNKTKDNPVQLPTNDIGEKWIEDDEVRLVHVLFDNYNKIVRPVKDKKAFVPVTMGMALAQIVDLDEKNQILETSVWLRLRWTNDFLSWNKSEFGGISSINVQPNLLWLPDIELYNSASGDLSDSFKTRVILKSSGENVWFIPVILKSRCKVDIEYFPFDEQRCPLKFGSWTYHGLELALSLAADEADLLQYQTNGEFELISARAKVHVTKYSCCDEPYINLIFTIHFRRKILFYLNNLVVPCILITVASLFTFILPPNTGERVSLVITTLLSLTVFMLMIAENTPTTSDVTPMIAKFFMASMLEIGLALAVTCLILNVYHSTRLSVPLPHFIRILAIDVLAPLLHISVPSKSKHKKSNESTREGRGDERFLLTHELREINHVEQMNGHVHHDVMPSTNDVTGSPNDVICLSSDRQHEFTDDTVHSDCDCRHVVVHCSGRGGLSSKAEETLVNSLNYLAEREREKERQEATLDEWEIVAKVADRSFLILFLLTITCTSLMIFTQAPHYQETTN